VIVSDNSLHKIFPSTTLNQTKPTKIMKNTLHAPAPWAINRISRWHDGTPQEFDLLEVVSREGYQLAITHNCKPKAVATANLIASAPDLLDALEFLLADYLALNGELLTRSTIPADKAREALRKAKGEA
jgi:hypothetical protein